MKTNKITETTRLCSSCQTVKHIDEFWKCKTGSQERHNKCKDCQKKYYASRTEILKNHRLISRYNIDTEGMNKIKTQQNHCCAICKLEKTLVIDHCHSSGKVRGLLCHQCNTAIGQLYESVDNLKSAIEYLSK